MVFGAVSTRRRDTWPSRKAAEAKFKSTRFYNAWDPRVFDRWMSYGLCDLPSTHDGEPPQVTLTTSKEQELFMFERPTYRGKPGIHPHEDKDNYADLDPTLPTDYPSHPFYRPEAAYVYDHLPAIRPPTMWIFGGASPLEKSTTTGPPDTWNDKVARTGVGVGGGGGAKHGQVEQAVIPEAGHLVAFEKVSETADHISKFLGREMQRWRRDAEDFKKQWVDKPEDQKSFIDEQWKANVDYTKFEAGPESKQSKL